MSRLIVVLFVAITLATPVAGQQKRYAARTPPERYQIAAGTALLLKLKTPVDSATAKLDQQVDATVWSPVIQNGIELIPAGSTVSGRVSAVEPASERKLLGTLTMAFNIVAHAETGHRATVTTRPIAIEAVHPIPPDGKKVKKSKLRPVDVALGEGASLVAVTTQPLVVQIGK